MQLLQLVEFPTTNSALQAQASPVMLQGLGWEGFAQAAPPLPHFTGQASDAWTISGVLLLEEAPGMMLTLPGAAGSDRGPRI